MSYELFAICYLLFAICYLLFAFGPETWLERKLPVPGVNSRKAFDKGRAGAYALRGKRLLNHEELRIAQGVDCVPNGCGGQVCVSSVLNGFERNGSHEEGIKTAVYEEGQPGRRCCCRLGSGQQVWDCA